MPWFGAVILVGGGLLFFGLFTSPGQELGMAIGPRCWVGVQGHEARVEVQGWLASKGCQSIRQGDGELYDAEPSDAPVICRVAGAGLRYTVRDRGLLNLYGGAICAALSSTAGTGPTRSAPPQAAVPVDTLPPQGQAVAISTRTAGLVAVQTAEVRATAVVAEATSSARFAPQRATATALAHDASVSAMSTRAVEMATAVVAAAQSGAESEATQLAVSGSAARSAEATQTATTQQANATWAAYVQRVNAAAGYVGLCSEAKDIAARTTTVGEAVDLAKRNQASRVHAVGSCDGEFAGSRAATTVTPQPQRLPTLTPNGSNGDAAGTAPSPSLRGALARVLHEGYAVPDSGTYRESSPLRVLIGVAATPARSGQRAFFFYGDRYLGTDAWEPSAAVSVASQDENTVALRYALDRGAPLPCCQPAPSSIVRFGWDGTKLTPLDAIPALDRRS